MEETHHKLDRILQLLENNNNHTIINNNLNNNNYSNKFNINLSLKIKN